MVVVLEQVAPPVVNTSSTDAIAANGADIAIAIHIASGGRPTHAGSTSSNVARALHNGTL